MREKKGRETLIGFDFVIALSVVRAEEAIQKFPAETMNVKEREEE